jgi:hypothetical protein
VQIVGSAHQRGELADSFSSQIDRTTVFFFLAIYRQKAIQFFSQAIKNLALFWIFTLLDEK